MRAVEAKPASIIVGVAVAIVLYEGITLALDLKAGGSISVARSGFSRDGGWVTDDWEPGIMWSLQLPRVLYDAQSKFQRVAVHDSALGRVLTLDGILQAAERDEKGYHEMITHVPLCRQGASNATNKRALVIGGGDGGAVREILRHSDISDVTHCEIDPAVIRVAKDFLPTIWQHPFEDKDGSPAPLHVDVRYTLINQNAIEYLRNPSRRDERLYDLIIVDASDPIGPGKSLYETEFYELLKSVLRPGGAVSVQGGSFFWLSGVFNTVYHQLKKVFPVVKPYSCFTAIYPGGVWNLQLATLGDDPALVDPRKVDAIRMRPGASLDWYSEPTHRHAFVLPPIAKRVLKQPPMTLDELEKSILE